MAGSDMKREESGFQRYGVYFILIGILIFVVWVRIRLLSVPLERDEGEYAYAGQLILQGIPPYEQVYNMKLPGIYAVYAVILAVFGQSHQGIHLGLLVVNLASILFVYLLGQRLFNRSVGALSAAVYGLMSVGQSSQGFVANAEPFVILPALAGCWLLLRAMGSGRLLTLAGAGVLLGLAFVIKQHGAAFVLFGGAAWCVHSFTRKPFQLKKSCMTTGILFLATAAPFGVTCLIMWVTGVFDKFWFWTFDYARAYSSAVPLQEAWRGFMKSATYVMSTNELLWIIAVIGLVLLLFKKTAMRSRLFVFGLSLFSFLAICPGFYFRPHYFLFLLPAAALLAGHTLFQISALFSHYRSITVKQFLPITLIVMIFVFTIYPQRLFLFQWSPFQVCRSSYYDNPFPESLPVAQYLKEHTDESDTIAVIGSEPQIYFYAHRRSATGYIYMYPLMETHPFARKMQLEMIHEIEDRRPEYIIMVTCGTSWLRRRESNPDLFQWMSGYGQQYHSVGVVEVYADTYREIWGPPAMNYTPRTKSYLRIFKRND